MATYTVSDGRSNFVRLTRLLISEGTKVLREFFDSKIPTANLAATLTSSSVNTRLQQMRNAKQLTQPQWNVLFPSPGTCGSSQSFDITLLFKLLREFCSLTPPATGWDRLPNSTDLSTPADLARIKYYRNSLYGHVNEEMQLSDDEFTYYWNEIKDALLRIVRNYDPSTVSDWENVIDDLLTAPLTNDDKRNIEELKVWYLDEMQLIEVTEQLSREIQDLRIQQHQLCHKLEISNNQKGLQQSGGTEEMVIKCMYKFATGATWLAGSSYLINHHKDNPMALITTVSTVVLPTGILVYKIIIGSIEIIIKATTLDALEELWKRYKGGKLKEELEKVFLTEKMRTLAGEGIELVVEMDEEQYRRAQRALTEVQRPDDYKIPGIKRRSDMIQLKDTDTRIFYRKLIGQGSYGEVWSAEWNRKEVAAKRIHGEFFKREYGQEITNQYIGEFRKEWEILRKLDHPNIVKMHTVLFPPKESPVIVMELMHCDLLNYIKNSTSTPKVSPSKGLSIALGIAEGLEYLHGLKPPVVHRNLATKNILLTVDGQPKIADLGVAKVFAAGKDDFATVGPGTPVYSAPETYLNVSRNKRAKYGVKVDIFSFGVVLLAINVGHEPVVLPMTHRKDGKEISEVERRENDLQQMEDARLKQLVIACLQEKSSNRPHASTIVKELQKIKVEQEKVECDQHVHFEKVRSQTSPDYHFKVLLIGNSYVGKSSLFELLENPVFNIDRKLKATMLLHQGTHWFEYDSSYVELQLVDTSGEERWFAMTSSYYRDVDGVFLVYDVSDKESFENLPYWINNVNGYTTKDCVQMVLVGNKVDLRESKESRDMVSQERGSEFAKLIKFPFVETSATDIDSVMIMCKKMIEILIKANISRIEDVNFQVYEEVNRTIKLHSSPKKKVPRKCCKRS